MQKIIMVKLMGFSGEKMKMKFFSEKLNISIIKSWLMKRFYQYVLKSYIVSQKIFLVKYHVKNVLGN